MHIRDAKYIGVALIPFIGSCETLIMSAMYQLGERSTIVSQDTITAINTTVSNGAEIVFSAKNRITLGPGFFAAQGGRFIAMVDSPLQPPLVSETTGITSNGFCANWVATINALGYCIDVATDINFSNIVYGHSDIQTGNVISYNISDLSPSQTYYFRIRAITPAGITYNSSTQQVSTTEPPDVETPTAPTNLLISSLRFDSVALAWGASTDNVAVSLYRIYRNGSQYAETSTASYTDDSVSPSSSYVYAVSAVDSANNESNQSNAIAVTTPAMPSNAPTISTQPTPLVALLRSSAIFSVAANGPNLTYQWYKDTIAIAGATSSSYSISNVIAANAGTYYVVVTNLDGSVTSNSVQLMISVSNAIIIKGTDGQYYRISTIDFSITPESAP